MTSLLGRETDDRRSRGALPVDMPGPEAAAIEDSIPALERMPTHLSVGERPSRLSWFSGATRSRGRADDTEANFEVLLLGRRKDAVWARIDPPFATGFPGEPDVIIDALKLTFERAVAAFTGPETGFGVLSAEHAPLFGGSQGDLAPARMS